MQPNEVLAEFLSGDEELPSGWSIKVWIYQTRGWESVSSWETAKYIF